MFAVDIPYENAANRQFLKQMQNCLLAVFTDYSSFFFFVDKGAVAIRMLQKLTKL